MPLSIHGTNGITFNDGSTQNTRPAVGFRNRIINGDMRIDQRNSGASVTNPSNLYTLDRWASSQSQTSKYSVQRNAGSVTPPSGFTNYLGVTSLSSYSVGASENFGIYQPIEGFNASDLDWGRSTAKPVTLSFWARSSLAGTFGVSLLNSSQNRSYPATYSINSANTWEYKTITISGDTSGTWLTNNGVGIYLFIGLGVGSTFSGTAGSWSGSSFFGATGATSVVGTSGATFYITGVQLEAGSTATDFEIRPIGTELALCQRYYENVGAYLSTTSWTAIINPVFPRVQKRSTPTITTVPASGSGAVFTWQGSTTENGNGSAYQTTGNSVSVQGDVRFSSEL